LDINIYKKFIAYFTPNFKTFTQGYPYILDTKINLMPARTDSQRSRRAEQQRIRRARQTQEQQNQIRQDNSRRRRVARSDRQNIVNSFLQQQPQNVNSNQQSTRAQQQHNRQSQQTIEQGSQISHEESRRRSAARAFNQEVVNYFVQQPPINLISNQEFSGAENFEQASVLLIERPNFPFYRAARCAQPVLTYFHIGLMTKQCSHCSAIHFENECIGTLCCINGKISLPFVDEPPPFLKELLSGETPESNRFLKKIRAYNTALSFASFGADIVSGERGGPSAFKIHGSVYHHQSSVSPSEGSRSNFAQLFFLDDNEANSERLNYPGREDCNRAIKLQIAQYMALKNPFVAAYKNMQKLMQEQEQLLIQNSLPPRILTLFLQQNTSTDPRVYNLPTSNEVAVLMPTNQLPTNRDIKVHTRHNIKLSTPQTSPSIDPLCYPIFYPKGEPGWTSGIPYALPQGRQSMPICEFNGYRLAVPNNVWNPVHYGRRLFQQLLVDLYCRVKGNR
jgi:hypothetical protein